MVWNGIRFAAVLFYRTPNLLHREDVYQVGRTLNSLLRILPLNIFAHPPLMFTGGHKVKIWFRFFTRLWAALISKWRNFLKAISSMIALCPYHMWWSSVHFRLSCRNRGKTIKNKNKKLISRWDSEGELFTTTSYTYYEIQKKDKNTQLSSR